MLKVDKNIRTEDILNLTGT